MMILSMYMETKRKFLRVGYLPKYLLILTYRELEKYLPIGKYCMRMAVTNHIPIYLKENEKKCSKYEFF